MSKEYTKVELPKLWPEFRKAETNTKFNKPSRERRYIKILALCLTYAPAKLMFPNTKNPLMHMVRDMCRAGLLDRYTRRGDRKFYYKTTHKGQDFLIKTLEENY